MKRYRGHSRCGAWAVVILALHGCAGETQPPPAAAQWLGTVHTEGRVTTVTTEAGSVWRSARLIEEVSIGTVDGDDAEVFSQIRAVASTDERIYVVDTGAVAVRMYSLDGEYLGDIGGIGDGPGEFRRPWAIGWVAGSRLLVRDRSQGRVHVLSLDGSLLADFRVTGASRTTVANDGTVWVHGWMPTEGTEPRRLGMLPHRLEGSVPASIPIPDPPPTLRYVLAAEDQRFMELGVGAAVQRGLTFDVNQLPFAPYPIWWLGPDASMLSGIPEDYRVERRHVDGTITRIVKAWRPVPVDAAEARWYRDRITAFWREVLPQFAWQAGDLPTHKRAYMALFADAEGRVWAFRELAGLPVPGCDRAAADIDAFVERPCWRQPYAMDGFDPTGRFLGTVALPDGMLLSVPPDIRGERMVAVFEDAAGMIMVKRFRLDIAR